MLDDCWKAEHASHVPTVFVFQVETPRKIGLENAHPVRPTGHEGLKFYLFEANETASIDSML